MLKYYTKIQDYTGENKTENLTPHIIHDNKKEEIYDQDRNFVRKLTATYEALESTGKIRTKLSKNINDKYVKIYENNKSDDYDASNNTETNQCDILE